MTGREYLVAAVCALGLTAAQGCGSEYGRMAGPRFEYIQPTDGEPVCSRQGDIEDGQYIVEGCETAANGFWDQDATFQYSGIANQVAPYPQKIYWFYEFRHSQSGAGRRLLDVGHLVPAPGYSKPTYVTAEFSVKLVNGLEGVSIVGFVGGCPDTLDLVACIQFAEADPQNRAHEEPWLCIRNPAMGVLAGCDALDKVTTNLNPTSSFVIQSVEVVSECSPTMCQVSKRWVVDATGSADPEGASLVYDWWFADGTTYQSTSPTAVITTSDFSLWCTGTPCWAVRLRATDSSGGVDRTGS